MRYEERILNAFAQKGDVSSQELTTTLKAKNRSNVQRAVARLIMAGECRIVDESFPVIYGLICQKTKTTHNRIQHLLKIKWPAPISMEDMT